MANVEQNANQMLGAEGSWAWDTHTHVQYLHSIVCSDSAVCEERKDRRLTHKPSKSAMKNGRLTDKPYKTTTKNGLDFLVLLDTCDLVAPHGDRWAVLFCNSAYIGVTQEGNICYAHICE